MSAATAEDYSSWTFRLRYVRCGRLGCKCNQGNEGFWHGPYWYGYKHTGGKVRSKYFGKRPTSTFQYAQDVAPEVDTLDPRWQFGGRMDFRTALRIFGLAKKPNSETLQARYRALIWENHPDHGGDTRIAAAINAAYSYLR